MTQHTDGTATSRATAESPVTPSSVLRRFTTQAAELHGAPDGDYAALWQWSVDHVPRFWRAIWEFFDVPGPQRHGSCAG